MNVDMKRLTDLMTTWTEEAKKFDEQINFRFSHPVEDERFREDAAKVTKKLNEDLTHYLTIMGKVEFTLNIMGLRWNGEKNIIEHKEYEWDE